jgi:hypothetical protein
MNELIIERQSADTLLLNCGTVDTTSWTPPIAMTFQQWAEIGRKFQQVETSINWWLGDWLNEGERRYGETYTQAIEVTGHKADQLRQCKLVAAKVKKANRLAILSWTHHLKIAFQDDDIQRVMLAQAVEYELSTRELEEAVKDYQDNLRRLTQPEPEPEEEQEEPEPTPPPAIDPPSTQHDDTMDTADNVRMVNHRRWVTTRGADLPVVMKENEHEALAIWCKTAIDTANWTTADHCYQIQKQAMHLRDKVYHWSYPKYLNYYTALRAEVCKLYGITIDEFEAHAETARLWPQKLRRQNETLTYRHHYLLRNRTEDREYYLQRCTIDEWSAERLAEELKGQRP